MTLHAPTVQLPAACRAYLEYRLTTAGLTLPVGVTPPPGAPSSYALINQLGSDPRGPVTDYLLRVRVFNADAYKCGQYALFVHAALMDAAQHRIVIPSAGAVWITGVAHQMGPSDLDDPDVPLFGQQMAVFWTTAIKPIEGVTL